MAKRKIPGGFYMTLDGIDGCGKGTQIKLLKKRLERDFDTELFREPGSTNLAEVIRREILLNSQVEDFGFTTEMFLYMASRADLFDKKIIPSLRSGRLVIGDRSKDATLAYQGYGGGENIETIRAVGEIATYGVNPILTFIPDVPIEIALKRLEEKGAGLDRIESRLVEYWEAVRQGYLEIARREPNRCVVLDGTRPPEDIHEEIYRLTKERIDKVLGK